MNQPQTVHVWYRFVEKTGRTTFMGDIYMPKGSTIDDLKIGVSKQEYPKMPKFASMNVFADSVSWTCHHHIPPAFLVENLKNNFDHPLILTDANDNTEVGFSEKVYLEEVEDTLCLIANRLARIYEYPHNPKTGHTIADLIKVKDDYAREKWDYIRYTEDKYVEYVYEPPFFVRKGDPIASEALPEIYDGTKWNHIEEMYTRVNTRNIPQSYDSAIDDLKELNRIASHSLWI
jgi:hypothetical protein